MNKLLTALLASIMVAAIPTANAATVAGNFNVTVSLTSVCTMAAIGDLAFGTYTAFQATAKTATATTATLTCTRGLTGVTANFDTAAPGSTAAAAATNAVGAGVIAGLQYDITATPGSTTAGTAATASSIGTADSRPYSIAGTMPANQAGAAAAGVQTQVRTLTVNY
ncbi:MAG TPA: spore coat protein U domain-containing protein [Methylotenera sp.]|nr:spore coat protein U domain-containing protein [Methylotenera sp.]